MRTRPPELRPRAADEPERLGPGTTVWAAIGLAALVFVTLPAVFEHGRLAQELSRLEGDVREAERRLDRLRREATDEPTVRFLREKATRRIAHDGRLYLRRRDAALKESRRR